MPVDAAYMVRRRRRRALIHASADRGAEQDGYDADEGGVPPRRALQSLCARLGQPGLDDVSFVALVCSASFRSRAVRVQSWPTAYGGVTSVSWLWRTGELGHSLWKSRRARGLIAYSKEPVKKVDMCPIDTVARQPRFQHRSSEARTNPSMPTQRFLQLTEVSEILNISAAQAYALVRSGELPAIKVGGRGQWRVETTELENYIQRMYSETRQFVAAHPFGTGTDDVVV